MIYTENRALSMIYKCYQVYKDDIKFQTRNRQKAMKTQKYQKLVRQKNKQKTLTYINPY